MKKIIKEQLLKLKNVKVDFDDSTTEIFIKKVDHIILEQDHTYNIELTEGINNSQLKSYLMANYNNNRWPKNTKYIASIDTISGNMVKLEMVSDTDRFYGWLPIDCINVLSEEKN